MDLSNKTDWELYQEIADLANGGFAKNAMTELYSRHKAVVERKVRFLVRQYKLPEAAIDDICQEVFISGVIDKQPWEQRNGAKLSTYLCGIAFGKVYAYAKKFEKNLPLDEKAAIDSDPLGEEIQGPTASDELNNDGPHGASNDPLNQLIAKESAEESFATFTAFSQYDPKAYFFLFKTYYCFCKVGDLNETIPEFIENYGLQIDPANEDTWNRRLWDYRKRFRNFVFKRGLK